MNKKQTGKLEFAGPARQTPISQPELEFLPGNPVLFKNREERFLWKKDRRFYRKF